MGGQEYTIRRGYEGAPRINVLLIGDGGVGKTTLMKTIEQESYFEGEDGRGQATKHKGLFDIEKTIKGASHLFKIVDIGGQPQFWEKVDKDRLHGIDVVCIVFDLSREESLYSGVKEHHARILSQAANPIPQLLVGCKADKPRTVEFDDIFEVAKKYDVLGYLETSAKSGHHVADFLPTMLAISRGEPLPDVVIAPSIEEKEAAPLVFEVTCEHCGKEHRSISIPGPIAKEIREGEGLPKPFRFRCEQDHDIKVFLAREILPGNKVFVRRTYTEFITGALKKTSPREILRRTETEIEGLAEKCFQQATQDKNIKTIIKKAPKKWEPGDVRSFLRFVAAWIQQEKLLPEKLPKEEVGRVVFYVGAKALASTMDEQQIKDLFALLKR